MKFRMIWVCVFVWMNISISSCGISTKSKLKSDRADSAETEENVKDLDLGEDVGQSEIILPMHYLKGMSNSSLASQAFAWWQPKKLWIRFRLSMAPFSRDEHPSNPSTYLEYRKKLDEHKKASGLNANYPFYMMAAASDFYRDLCPVKDGKCQCSQEELAAFMKNPDKLYLDPNIAQELLKDPQVKGLYLHELLAFSNLSVPAKNAFNCPKTGSIPVLWNKLIAYADAAKKANKQIIWNDAGDEGAWKWLLDALNSAPGSKLADRVGSQELFKNYGSVIVPLWANNRATGDANENDPCPTTSTNGKRLFCDKINNSIVALKSIVSKYSMSRYGSSIQDWHTMAAFSKPANSQTSPEFQECIRRDVLNYTSRAQLENTKVFEFESYWASEGFFKAIVELKDSLLKGTKISTVKWPTPMRCVKK